MNAIAYGTLLHSILERSLADKNCLAIHPTQLAERIEEVRDWAKNPTAQPVTLAPAAVLATAEHMVELESDVDDLEEQLKDKQDALDGVRIQRDMLKAENERLHSAGLRAQAECVELRTRLFMAESEVARLRAALADVASTAERVVGV